MKLTGISGVALVAMLGLAGCGGGGSGEGATPPPGSAAPPPSAPPPSPSPTPAPTYSIGGSVTGLVGSALVIANNGGDELTLTDPGDFQFATELLDAAAYAVTIVSQPVNPERFCTLANASGNVAGTDVGSIEITCTGPLALTASAPVDGDEQVSRAIQPLLTYSADVDAVTATASVFTLVSQFRQETLDVDVVGNRVTLVPQEKLLPLTDYTLTISEALRGTGGERPVRSETLSFRTRDGEWSEDEPLGAGRDAHVATAPGGRAWVVWTRPTGGVFEVVVDGYDPAVGWLHDPTVIGQGFGPVIATDAAGNVTVAWQHETDDSVQARRYDAALETWENPVPVSEAGARCQFIDVDVDAQGRVLLIWQQVDVAGQSVGSAYFNGTAWNAPLLAETTLLATFRPRVRFLPDGTALAVWSQYDGGAGSDIVGNLYSPASGWGTAQTVSDNVGIAYYPDLAVDRKGNALALWGQDEGFEEDIYASYYTVTGGWQPPVPVESQSGNTDYPKVAFAPDGSALAVWEQIVSSGGGNESFVYQNRFTPAAGWGTESAISSVGSAFYPKIAIDSSGNAISSWWILDLAQGIDAYSVWANRYTPDAGWTAAESIAHVGELIDTFGPRLAMDANGTAFTAWGANSVGVSACRFE